MNNERKVRESNYELLRIIAMILIVMSHCDEIFGLSTLYSLSLGPNKLVNDFLHMGGQIGVGSFLLISGFFMVNKNVSISKLLKLAGEVWSYSIGIWLCWVCITIYQGSFNIATCLHEAKYAFFPIVFSHYWFVTAFFILMLLSPFLNKFISILSQNNYKIFLFILILFLVILQGGFPGVLQGMAEGRILPVLLYYFMAGYIKRFGIYENKNPKICFLVAIIGYVLLFCECYLCTALGLANNNKFLLDNIYFYRVLNSPFIVVICIALFIGVCNTTIKYNRIVNSIASCVFGIYLIHSNRLMSELLPELFPIYRIENSVFLLIGSMCAVICIFSVCVLIDYMRNITIGRVWDKLIGRFDMLIQR